MAPESGSPAPRLGSTREAGIADSDLELKLEVASSVTVEERAGAESGVMVLATELPVAWRAGFVPNWCANVVASPEKETPESLVML